MPKPTAAPTLLEAEGPPLTVLRLEVEGYMRIRAAHVTPTPRGLVLVRGRNAQGKSSLIGSMADAFGVERPAMPITEGEHAGEVSVTLGCPEDPSRNLVVRERFTRDAGGQAKRVLTIEAADGSRLSGPAAILKELRGHFADPVAFLDMTADEQARTALRVLGLADKLERLEQVAQGHYDHRRDLGREADRLSKAEAQLRDEVTALPPPPTSGSVDELVSELRAANDHNAVIDRNVQDLEACTRAGQVLADRIRLKQAELERVQAELAGLAAERERCAERWTVLSQTVSASTRVDVAPIEERLREHEEASKFAARRELYAATAADALAARTEHANAEAALEGARAKIAELLQATPFPVEGMAYDHEAKSLTVGGIPLSQASQAERLKVAAAVAMAGGPRLRVLFAREGSLLDAESQALLAQLALDRGFQLWLEVVDSTAEGAGIWIEDGEAYGPHAEPAGG